MVEVRELIKRLAAQERTTFFVSSHLISEMEMICNRIGILHKGKLIREGGMAELLKESGQSLETYFVAQLRIEREEARHESAAVQYH